MNTGIQINIGIAVSCNDSMDLCCPLTWENFLLLLTQLCLCEEDSVGVKEGDTKAKSFFLDHTLNNQNTGTIGNLVSVWINPEVSTIKEWVAECKKIQV